MSTTADWKPTASLNVLRLRAAMLNVARGFFARRDILEVTTPALNAATVTDVHVASIPCRLAVRPERPFFLHTSPEYRMKQLIAAYHQDIYQICRVYRDNELGHRHQVEFTMIEWYRQARSLDEMISETAQLITTLAAAGEPAPAPMQRWTYAGLFERTTGLDPLSSQATELAKYAREVSDISESLAEALGDDEGAWLDYLFSHVVTPSLRHSGLVAVTQYPATQAALARLNPSDTRVAERFEIFWDGLELANGYRELTDMTEQRERFVADQALRRARNLPEIPVDQDLLAALEAGLPDCCGVALGFDRLVMHTARLDSLASAVSFALT